MVLPTTVDTGDGDPNAIVGAQDAARCFGAGNCKRGDGGAANGGSLEKFTTIRKRHDLNLVFPKDGLGAVRQMDGRALQPNNESRIAELVAHTITIIMAAAAMGCQVPCPMVSAIAAIPIEQRIGPDFLPRRIAKSFG
jgi:hypothetical protein